MHFEKVNRDINRRRDEVVRHASSPLIRGFLTSLGDLRVDTVRFPRVRFLPKRSFTMYLNTCAAQQRPSWHRMKDLSRGCWVANWQGKSFLRALQLVNSTTIQRTVDSASMTATQTTPLVEQFRGTRTFCTFAIEMGVAAI